MQTTSGEQGSKTVFQALVYRDPCITITATHARPCSALLERYETRSLAGMIFAWDGASGRGPRLDRPLEELEQDGWSGPSFYRTHLRGHPQATTEKTIYLLHLSNVHGSTEVKQLRPVELSGQVTRTGIELTLGSQERRFEHPQRRLIGMAFLPVCLRTPIMKWFTLSQEPLSIRQDNVNRSRRRYRSGILANDQDAHMGNGHPRIYD